MIITRANVEKVLIGRRGKVMTYVGWDGATLDGTNADLTDSIAAAIMLLGGIIDNITSVTDVDIATIPEGNQMGIFDASEMYLVMAIRGQILSVDEVTGPFAAKLSQLPERLLADWKLLKAELEDVFGIGGIQPFVGIIEQDFAAHGSEDANV